MYFDRFFKHWVFNCCAIYNVLLLKRPNSLYAIAKELYRISYKKDNEIYFIGLYFLLWKRDWVFMCHKISLFLYQPCGSGYVLDIFLDILSTQDISFFPYSLQRINLFYHTLPLLLLFLLNQFVFRLNGISWMTWTY